MARKAPRWYFSFRSPYSWFAYLDLVERHRAVAEAIEWIPYWEPDEWTGRLLAEANQTFSYSPMSRDKHFYILQDARRISRARGLSMTWPLDRTPHWEVAHLAYLAAHDAGCGPEFVAGVYRARWEEGRDISDRATIADVARRIGADPAVADALDDPGLRQRGAEALARGTRDGVFGVPFFVHGREKFWGVDRLDAYVAAFTPTGPPATATAVADPVAPDADELVLVPQGDGGHAGGCG
jgi:2-hydroxychromene-2-carboxylate isomerase